MLIGSSLKSWRNCQVVKCVSDLWLQCYLTESTKFVSWHIKVMVRKHKSWKNYVMADISQFAIASMTDSYCHHCRNGVKYVRKCITSILFLTARGPVRPP